MSMCYLCDLCRHMRGWSNAWVWKCYGIRYPLITELKEKKAFDYGRDDPYEICKHFEPKEDSE